MNDDQIRRAFTRLQDDVRRTVRPSDGLDRIHGRRWWHAAIAPTLGFAVVALAVVIGAAVLRGGDPGPVVTTGPGPDPSLPVPDTTSPTPEETIPSPDPTTPGFRVFGPVVVTGGDLLLAGPEGVAVAGPDGTDRITDAPARVAAGDRRGGVVFESAGAIWHVPGGSSEARLLVEGAELHDVAVVDGQPSVIFAVSTAYPDGEVSTVVRIDLLGLDTGRVRPLYETEGYEGGVTRVSHGGGAFAITEAAEGFEWFHFVDIEGRRLEGAAYERGAQQQSGFVGQAVLSGDGARVAFLESEEDVVGMGEPIDLVVWDLSTGTEITRIALPAGNYEYWFVRMDFRGNEAVVGRLVGAREPFTALVVDLDTGATVETGARGMPSIAGDAVPDATAPPVTGDAAPIPDAGLGRGYVLAEYDRLVWHSHPDDPGAPAESRLLVKPDESESYLGEPWYAFSDGAGGIVYGTGTSPVRRLRPGATAPDVVYRGGEESYQPLLGVAEIDGEPTGWFLRHREQAATLWTVNLDGGETSEVVTIEVGERGWVGNVSHGGGEFLVSAVVDECPTHFTVTPDGERGRLPALPDPGCGAGEVWTEQARLSPDGRLVVFVRAGSGGWEPELGGPVLRQPVELVVAEADTGREQAVVNIGTPVQDVVLVHDFDGRRVVVSRTAYEPALAPQVMFVIDLGCGGCTRRHDTVAAGGAGLTGAVEGVGEPATDIVVPGCSLDGQIGGLDMSDRGLPAAVADMRRAIIEAAAACDFDALDDLALQGEFNFHFDSGAPGMFREAEQLGSPEVQQLYRMLGLPHGSLDVDGETYYVWPSAATYDTWDEVPRFDRDVLGDWVGFAELQSYEELGAYYGYRVGITETGDWVFVAAGD